MPMGMADFDINLRGRCLPRGGYLSGTLIIKEHDELVQNMVIPDWVFTSGKVTLCKTMRLKEG